MGVAFARWSEAAARSRRDADLCRRIVTGGSIHVVAASKVGLVGLSLPGGVRLFTRTLPAVIN
jgi:hypothetical protein